MAKFTATTTTGEVKTRNSKARVYTHAVEIGVTVGRERAYLTACIETGKMNTAYLTEQLAELDGRADSEFHELGVGSWSSSRQGAEKAAADARSRGFDHVRIIPVTAA